MKINSLLKILKSDLVLLLLAGAIGFTVVSNLNSKKVEQSASSSSMHAIHCELPYTHHYPSFLDDQDPDINDFVFLEKEPFPLNMSEFSSKIGYPKALREANISGKVIIRVLVGRDGRIERSRVLKSPHPLLTERVASKISELRFNPAIKDGRPIKTWVSIPFNFELR